MTRLLAELRGRRREAAPRLFDLLYSELRRHAQRHLLNERPEHTLQATALVHEAYLRLVDGQQDWRNRAHFFAIASSVMRRILVDHARARHAAKRPGSQKQLDLDEVPLLTNDHRLDVIAVDLALERLSQIDLRQSRIVEMRYFGGLTSEEAAEALGVTTITVQRDWAVAKAWLYKELAGRLATSTSLQWGEVKERFHQALQMPPEMRRAFLASAWPDEVVRAEVERLLIEDTPGAFSLSEPARLAASASTGLSLEPGGEFTGTDRFRLLGQLGAGTFGIVYRVLDGERNLQVALKRLLRCDPGSLLRFKNEFRLLADLIHPNLVQLYELFGEGRDWFFTMELISGVDFLSYVRPAGNIVSWDHLREALYQLATGVQTLHSSGRLHRDLKPSNVLVEAGGRVVILDFGLVRTFEADSAEQTFTLAGSPAYMAPEQAAGRAISQAADWYAVGVMLFKALTGLLPFTGAWNEILEGKQRRSAPRPRDFVTHVPQDLDEACHSLLQRDPALRAPGKDILHARGTQDTRDTSRVDEFIGRHVELRIMHRYFATVTAGRGQTVLVRGHSGIGKTSFLVKFLRDLRCERPDVIVLRGRCRESESMAYKALDPIVDELVKYLRHLPESAGSALLPRSPELLRRLFPVFSDLELLAAFPDKLQEDPDEQQLRRRAFEALRELFGRMSDRRPVVISIDDVQWGDLDSLAFLTDLVLPPNAPALMLILAFRSESAADNPVLQILHDLEIDRVGRVPFTAA